MTNVLIVSHSMIPSVLLCGHSQLSYLKKKSIIDYRFTKAHLITTEYLSWANIIIFLRSESELEAYVSKLCKKAGKHCVYVLDDDLLNAPSYLSSSFYYNRPDIKHNIKTIMNNCNTFLTPSRVMLKKYGSQFKNSFIIEEPSLDAIKIRKHNKKIRIGFAGSIDRAQDINNILTNALEEIIFKYHNDIEIEFMGAKPDIVDKHNLNYIPYQDSYEKYTSIIKERNWDIGLAPMPISEFHSCKYFNKYVEYASFGIVGIYTNCEPYISGIRNNENGLLVNNNTKEWVEAISLLIENTQLRSNLSTKCLEEANSIYSLEELSKSYLECILVGYKETKTCVNGLWKYRIITFVRQVLAKIKEKGLMFPVWVLKKLLNKIAHHEDY